MQSQSYWNKDKYLVYDFDILHQTGLHWAAKRNKPEIIKFLISKGALVDSRDIANRTPLIVASKWENIKWVKALLANEANPSIRTFLGLSAMDVTTNLSILSYLKKGYLLWVFSKFIDKAKKKEVWKREALEYFESENDQGIPFLM